MTCVSFSVKSTRGWNMSYHTQHAGTALTCSTATQESHKEGECPHSYQDVERCHYVVISIDIGSQIQVILDAVIHKDPDTHTKDCCSTDLKLKNTFSEFIFAYGRNMYFLKKI